MNKISGALICILFLSAGGAFAQFGKIKNVKSSKVAEIRQFDFLNATYEAGCAGEKVRVRKGHYESQNSAGAFFDLSISVSYGDLTGDGVEEAVVLSECSGAVQNYDEGKIYAVSNHRLVKLGELEVGTKNHGSIFSAKIKNGRIVVKRGPDPDRCTNIADAAEETTFFTVRRGKLRQIGKPFCKAI